MTIKERKTQTINSTAPSSKSIRLLPPRQSGCAKVSVKKITHSKIKSVDQFPIVGIGASTGGLTAFEAFFSGMPAVTDPNIAFVLVQHLAPDHKSILTGIIQRYTRMQVTEVEDGMDVRPNCVYIIPPGRDMAFFNGSLKLLEPSAPHGQRLPIDFFFKSLARDQREKAIGIVLSGTGSDGTLGVRAIKRGGGMAMAQSPNTTEYAGMPKSAIATGLIDYELPPAKMAAQLLAFAAHAFNGLAWKNVRLGKLSLRELTEQALLLQVAPTGALVNRHGDILYLHGRTGMYLEPTPGESVVNNILEMAREGLRHELTAALRTTSISQEISHRTGLRVNNNGAFIRVNLTIIPMITGPSSSTQAPLYLVILEEVIPMDGNTSTEIDGSATSPVFDASLYIASLRQELRAKEQFLRVSNEDLKSSIEEMQSINEELQSTHEEMETSKDELLSTNEELAMVNAKLQGIVAALTQANNDINNMVAGTGIGTFFVDQRLRILRFTSDLTRIINLVQTDEGRPIDKIVCNFKQYHNLTADIQIVLDTLIPKERDVQTTEGLWYTMRIHPYRTCNNVVEGAVINFIEITERKQTVDSLQKAFDEIRLLRGIIPICTQCRQIRDEEGSWSQIEVYVQNHPKAELCSELCPECAKEFLPDYGMEPGSTGDL